MARRLASREGIGVGQSRDPLQVLHLGRSRGDLPGHRQREVQVLGTVGLVAGVARREQLTPHPALEDHRHPHARTLAQLAEQPHDRSVVARRARVRVHALDVGVSRASMQE